MARYVVTICEEAEHRNQFCSAIIVVIIASLRPLDAADLVRIAFALKVSLNMRNHHFSWATLAMLECVDQQFAGRKECVFVAEAADGCVIDVLAWMFRIGTSERIWEIVVMCPTAGDPEFRHVIGSRR